MANESKQFKVAFNPAQKKLYDDLFVKQMISQAFPDFVKDAYHDKIDKIRSEQGLDLSTEEIENITFDAINRQTSTTTSAGAK